MSRTSRKVRRFEKEAILRAKEYEYRREQSDSLLSKLHPNPNEEDYDQHRKHLLMRRIQQVLRDDRNQTETEEEEYNQRKPTYDLHKNQSSTTATATATTNSNRTFRSSLLSSSDHRDDRSASAHQKSSSTTTNSKYSSLSKTS